MLRKEVLVTESPKHTDTRHSAIASRLHIHIAITYINSLTSAGMHQSQSLVYGIGSRLFLDAFLLSDGHVHQVAKVVLAESLGGFAKLIAHHATFLPLAFSAESMSIMPG